jgi:hypothetical protein
VTRPRKYGGTLVSGVPASFIVIILIPLKILANLPSPVIIRQVVKMPVHEALTTFWAGANHH